MFRVAIPGPALPTLLLKVRRLLGFVQRPVTFCSNGSPLVVKFHLSTLLQGLLQAVRWACQIQRGCGLQGAGDSYFPIHPGAGFPGQCESRGCKVQALVKIFLPLL